MNHTPLEIINAQNKRVYLEETEMIQRNVSVIVKRIPPPKTNLSSKVIIANQKRRAEKDISDRIKSSTVDIGNQEADLFNIDKSEDYKIQKMMNQTGLLVKIDNSIRCYTCGRSGHYKDKCPLLHKDSNSNNVKIKRPKGIPSSMLETIPGDSIDRNNIKEGVYVNRRGDYVIPIVDKPVLAKRPKYAITKDLSNANPSHSIPKELQCKLCHRLVIDAVSIQCCDNSFCDECIRNYLIDNNFHCPLKTCRKGDSFPDDLIPNIRLRKAVKHFLSKTDEEKHNTNVYLAHDSNSIDKNDTLSKVEDGIGTESLGEDSIIDPSLEAKPQEVNLGNNNNMKNSKIPPQPLFLDSHTFEKDSEYLSTIETINSDSRIPDKELQSNTHTNSKSQLYPLLTEEEFYFQQALYRKK
ncbi:hypothetical protein LOD99_2033 [Oopsacas minuta]|uniref:CCHC-type domain-containing protein n=1 Tax=Oopsacas minuta TaxID=111878 RepID=A0AAV7K4Z9_9METZ|nr:hypothetical protein LOD99_2033 [Oopsacas minuta]